MSYELWRLVCHFDEGEITLEIPQQLSTVFMVTSEIPRSSE
jgi:hypothetical protein